MARCQVCFRHCQIPEGKRGFCGARTCKEGNIIADNYGRITAMALDPIEKKPLNRYYPGSLILSVGSYGCNLRCPFCQNHDISWSDRAWDYRETAQYISPEELAATAYYYKPRGNIGVAYTYNEPLIGYEYVRDTARLVHEKGMKNVMVSNGMADLSVLEEIGPYIDAMNIDLKGFTDRYYSRLLQGDRQMVMEFISRAVQICHVELTTLIVPGENDTEEEILALSSWISRLDTGGRLPSGKEIPLHISRFFPGFHMNDRPATNITHIYRLAERARENLTYVYTGNC